MKAKIFTLLSFSLISLILFASLVNAATFTVSPSTLSFDNSNSKTFVISNPVATPLNVAFDSTISITGEGGYTVTFDVTGVKTGITNTTPSTITVDPQTTIDFSKFNLGESYSSNLVINSGTDSKTIKIEIVSNDFCEFSNEGNLDLTIDDIVVTGFSDDDNEWFPLDVVEIDIKVENNGNENVRDVEVEWCLFDNENKKCVLDDNENDFKLNDGDDNTITLKFTVDPDKLEKDVTDYTFFARATGKIDGGVLKGENSCASNSEDVEVMLESDFVVIDNIQYDELNECGSEAVISANVWNIGDSDQNDVVARVFLNEFNINKEIDVGDIDSFDKEKLSTLIAIPADAAEKTYHLQLEVYDDNGDIYESSNNDEVKYDVPFIVQGNCKPIITETEAEIIFDPLTAIQSGGKAGQKLVLQAKIANSGTEKSDFIISVLGLDSWATIESIEPSSVSLNPSASEDVIITLDVNSDVEEGDQEFTISVKSGSLASKSKTVKVPIEKSSGGFKFPGITGGVTGIISGDNWYLWGIGILNVILVIIIIIVAVRVARS